MAHRILFGSKKVGIKRIILLVLLLIAFVFFIRPDFNYTAQNKQVTTTETWSSATIDFNKLSSNISEADIISTYSKLHLDCGHESSELGDRSCYTSINSINGADALFLVFFFNKSKLNLIKMDFTSSGHEDVLVKLKSQYGNPAKFKKSKQPIPLIKWVLKQGIITTNESAYRNRKTQVLWLSHNGIINSLDSKK